RVLALVLVVVIVDGLADAGLLRRHAREEAAAVMRAEQRLDALKEQRAAGDTGRRGRGLAQKARARAGHQRRAGACRRGAVGRCARTARLSPYRRGGAALRRAWRGAGRGHAAAAGAGEEAALLLLRRRCRLRQRELA